MAGPEQMENSRSSTPFLDDQMVDDQMTLIRRDIDHMIGVDNHGRMRAPDGWMRGYAEDLGRCYDDPRFKLIPELFRQAISDHPDRSPMTWVQWWQRHVNNFHMRHGGINYTSAASSMDVIEGLHDDPHERDIFFYNAALGIRTQIPDRGALFKAIAYLRKPERPLTIINIGGGEGQADKKILANDPQHNFRDIDVMDPLSNGYHELNPHESHELNYITQHEVLPVADIICVDLEAPLAGQKSEEAARKRLWDVSCFYTSEQLWDPPRMDEYFHWSETHFANLHYLQADARKLPTAQVRALIPNTEFIDAAYLAYSPYQLRAAGMRSLMPRLKSLMTSEDGKQHGYVVASDHARRTPSGRLRLVDRWQPWGHGTFLYDFGQPELGWQHMISARNGRLGRIALEKSFGLLPAAQEEGLRSKRSVQDRRFVA